MKLPDRYVQSLAALVWCSRYGARTRHEQEQLGEAAELLAELWERNERLTDALKQIKRETDHLSRSHLESSQLEATIANRLASHALREEPSN